MQNGFWLFDPRKTDWCQGHINGEPFNDLVLTAAYCPILLCLINVCDVVFFLTTLYHYLFELPSFPTIAMSFCVRRVEGAAIAFHCAILQCK